MKKFIIILILLCSSIAFGYQDSAFLPNKSGGMRAYGGIHVHDASTAQSIAQGTTYIKVTAFTDNNPSKHVTSDAANDKITFLFSGTYLISGSFSFMTGTNNVEVKGSAFLEDVEQDSVHFTRKIGTAGDVGSASFVGILTVTAGDDLDFRVRHDYAGAVNLTFSYANLSVAYLGL